MIITTTKITYTKEKYTEEQNNINLLKCKVNIIKMLILSVVTINFARSNFQF